MVILLMNIYWKDWYWSWNSNTLATWCEELTHLKRLWCWERLKVGGEGDDRGWDGWIASWTQWTCIWASSGSWWWTGKPGVLQSMGSQNIRHDWSTELNRQVRVPEEAMQMLQKKKSSLTMDQGQEWQPPGAHTVKNLCAMQETQVQSLGQEDLLEKEW